MKRRGPYGGVNLLPENIRTNGYVADLITEVQNAAAVMNRPVHVFQKNGEWFLAVMIPTNEELTTFEPPVEAL